MKALMAIVGAALVTASALGGGEECRRQAAAQAAAQAQAACDAAKTACQSGAPDRAALEAKFVALGIPAMTIEVGDKTTHCPLEAFAIARETGAKPVFHLAGQTYTDGGAAMDAWAGALRTKLDSLTQVTYVVNGKETQCSDHAAQMSTESGGGVQARLVSQTYSCETSAKQAALRAVQAADAAPFVITVAGTQYHCPQTAQEAAKITGEPVVYTVGGVSVQCEKTAMCLLLVNRILATADALERPAA